MPQSLEVPILICATLAASCWLLSLLTREYSWVDRLWSIAPVVYVGWFALPSGRIDARLVLMAVLVATWGARLTFNFARKGGYRRGGEDYRWAVLRARMSPAAFAVLNVVFICVFQHALLLGLTLPAWVARRHGPTPLSGLDAIAAILFVIFLAGEGVADEQQWRFQSDKRARRDRGEPVVSEFLTAGLFRYSRHPNFFCEQGLWWALYLFGVAAGGGWMNVSIVGPLALTALFHGSTAFTEGITLSRYPSYADYQRRTSRMLPWLPGR